MAEPLLPLTDPAREMADLLTALVSGDRNLTGDRHLAAKFDVEPWSQEFYRILATIMDRLHALKGIVQDLPLDDDFREEMVGHLNDIALAFAPGSFQNHWTQSGADKLSARNLQPLKGLSGLVRQQVSYRKLSDDEREELIGQVTELVAWLREHQLAENDFIRQALIEGLGHLLFRLERFRWLGWGYTLASLREVIAAYMLLERQDLDANVNPDAAAVLSKVGAVIKAVYAKLEKTKAVYETGDWLLKAYGAATLVQTAAPTVKGLLSAP